MRILLFSFAPLGGVGGVETVLRQLTCAFAARGHAVAVAELTAMSAPSWQIEPAITVWPVVGPSFPEWRRPRSWASFTRSTWQLVNAIRSFRPDVLNVHFPTTQAIPAVGAYALPHDWKLVVTLHNSDIRVAPIADPRIGKWQQRLFARATLATAVSGSLAEDAVARYPVLKHKIRVIHNGVERYWFEEPALNNYPLPSQPYVLCLGRLHPQKGVDILLAAWARVRSSLPGTLLWVVGNGPSEEQLRRLCDELGLQSSVRFSDFVPRDLVPLLHHNAEFVVLPSRFEGLPMTLLEAGACGAVCLATNVSGVSEIIEHGRTGFIVAPESPEQLASAIHHIAYLRGEERRRIGLASRLRIQSLFSIEAIAGEYLEAFEAAGTDAARVVEEGCQTARRRA